jgi:copper(I)-binding protein
MKRFLPACALVLLTGCSYFGLSESVNETAMAPAEAELTPVPSSEPAIAAAPVPLAVPRPALAIADAWVAVAPQGSKVAAGFLTVGNAGAEHDRIIAAASPRAGRIELHDIMADAKAKMGPVGEGIPVPAAGSVSLRQGGPHLMFMDIKEPFIAGQSIPVTLTFEKGGNIEVALSVRASGTTGAQH